MVVHTIRDYYILCARSTCYKHGTQCGTICSECKFFDLEADYTSIHAVVGISQFILDAHISREFLIVSNSPGNTKFRKPYQEARRNLRSVASPE